MPHRSTPKPRSATIWDNPAVASDRVKRLSTPFADPTRIGPVDLGLRVIDAARARSARAIIVQGLSIARQTPSIDQALNDCGAVPVGLAHKDESIRRAAASLAVRCPTPENARLLADLFEQPAIGRASVLPSAASVRQLIAGDHTPGSDRLLATLIGAARRGTLPPDTWISLAGTLLLPARTSAAWQSRDDLATIASAIRSAPGPAGALAAARLAPVPALAVAARGRLKDAITNEEAVALLRLAHLTIAPSRRIAFDTAQPMHQHGYRRSDPIEVRLGCVRLLRSRAGDPLSRRRVAAGAIADPDPRVRRSLVESAPPSVLADLCFETDARIARSATIRRSEAGLESPGSRAASEATRRLLTALTRSPHERVRHVARVDAERFGITHPHAGPTPLSALSLRRRVARGIPDALVPTREAILSDDPIASIAAIRLAKRAGQHHTLSPELVETVRRNAARSELAAHRVTATAIAALAGVSGSLPRRAIEIGLRHPDARVRANAVEAVSRDRATAARAIEHLKLDPNHRVRANVYRELARSSATEAAASDGLLEMLATPSKLPQLAALWAIERAALELKPGAGPAWQAIAERVAKLAIDLDDARINARASRSAQLLGAEFNESRAA